MAVLSYWFARGIFLLAYAPLIAVALQGTHVCERRVSFSQVYSQSYQYSRQVRYKTKCGFLGWGRCTRYRTVYGTRYRRATTQAYKSKDECCSGWSQVGNQCSQAICAPACIYGTCTKPNHCSCSAGYYGNLCDRGCPSHEWGPHCKHDCLCQNNATCSSQTGICTCTPGWEGQYCNKSCDIGYYGDKCQNKCQCQNVGSRCDVVSGNCTCGPGYQGIRCDEQCFTGSYGKDCALKCACLNGLCNHVDGKCNCTAGTAEEQCGINRTSHCDPSNCMHGGKCDHVTNTCNCTEGWTGDTCEQMCPYGTYGYKCAQQCWTCKHNETCNHVTGNCECRPGYTGNRCQNRCKVGTFGLKCSKICACQNNTTCSPINGSCNCISGYTGVHCEEKQCFDGENCTDHETQSDKSREDEEISPLVIIYSVLPIVIVAATAGIAIGCFVRYKRSKRMSEHNAADHNHAEATESSVTYTPTPPLNSLHEEGIYQAPSNLPLNAIHTSNVKGTTDSRHYDEPTTTSAANPKNNIYATPSVNPNRTNNCDDASVTMASSTYMELKKPSGENLYEPLSPITRNRTGFPVVSTVYDEPNVRQNSEENDDESSNYQQLQSRTENDYEPLCHASRSHPPQEEHLD